jgi:hypothetical protein
MCGTKYLFCDVIHKEKLVNLQPVTNEVKCDGSNADPFAIKTIDESMIGET